ncbi:unnamed protein product [Mycena citricolor]|uniref:Integrase core domain-containing protein n=1 Tax=Mycena citricolor TaxID=2018698 RepID=A0AAD2HEI1_9AGAR|nr:unnamed protein product [Mycena citricolor]CAK5274371.1 unnamed protein product [Mycena citricolor]
MGRNQHKPIPPAEDLQPFIAKYWKQNKSDVAILALLKKHHIDLSKYGLEIASFRKIHEKLGYIRARTQGHTVESIVTPISKLRITYPKAGGREMVSLLFHEENIRVARETVMHYFRVYEPDLVRERRQRHFKRKRFWAAGANDIWAVDQHDKWKYKFGLALHTSIDPFLGLIHWMRIWWNNNNPRLILSYYLDVIENLGVMPLVSQSDPGSENVGLANGHTQLRHYQDPSLVGTSQHRWMREKKNVKPEITWSQMRRRFTPGFEDILDFGVNQGWYDPGVLLEALVFRWVFIPWLQAELDNYRNRVNNTAKRHDRNKILPNGVPSHMFEFPEDYAILDFKIKADPVGIQKVRDMYAPPDHEIFQLVPLDFEVLISQIYRDIGEPPVNRKSCWEVYRRLLSEFNKLNELHVMHQSAHWTRALEMASNEYPDKIEVLPNLKELRGGEDVVGPGAYMGGVNQDPQHYARLGEMLNEIEPDLGPVEEEPESLYAWFSDEEDDLVADGDW